ncbi:xanthine dehydrogenase family protein molybdopterin-binding subunit [Rhodopseudomonas palustris]|uniref:Xanthine dehydrogenase family protein molybdopterin-binding subunit n=1 Tax=Rhodopseudomonas palustris TaxID=1076 RepID=A0A418V0X8_RHOPL|nr:xanthine dehydrogenase family protein molybdopterin-binding subunit [Rhodopseudomonas palustris]RJF69502.1 xanthine dehydrogenase family protein molybdopterin-binding subunit [Rhodopseudomonas palustris]
MNQPRGEQEQDPSRTTELIGQSVRRLEDDRFLRGHGRFLDDLDLPDVLHGVVLRSPHGHARLTGLDLEVVRAMPGVRLVLSYSDLREAGLSKVPLDIPPPGEPVPHAHCAEQPILADGFVRFVGDTVAFVVAETLVQARDAAEAIVADYDILPAIVDPTEALSDQVLAWSGSATNVVFDHHEGDADAVDAAFATADRVIELDVVSNRIDALPLETRACVGAFAGGDFTLYVSTQRVHILQRALADRVFKVGRERMRVVAPDTGGGFGQKNGLYPEYVLCLEAARRLGRAVKWVAERSEALQSDCHGRDNVFTIAAAVDAGARIRAIRATRLMNIGAYTAPRAIVPVLNGLTHLTGVYAIPAAHARVQGVLTNTACTSPFRGAGRPENVQCCERLIDVIARDYNLDPIDVRRRNLIALAAQPCVSPLGTTFERADFAAKLDDALACIDHAGFAARRKQARKRGRLRGLGVALYAEDLHGSHEPIPVHLRHRGGKLAVMVGSGSAGHGHETSFLQIASQCLGLPLARLAFVQSDTAQIPDGVGTAASWSLTLGGSSVHVASARAVEAAKSIAARLLDCGSSDVAFSDGLFRASVTNRVVGWSEIFEAEPEFAVSASFDGSGQGLPIGCHACEVEVDPDTGDVTIVAFGVAQDAGRIINPMLVTGQLHGGVAQGIGQAWSERIAYASDGQLMSGSLMDYGVARAADLPTIGTRLSQQWDDSNPLGVKGIGESAATGSSPAFVNAALDALAPLGVRHLDMPLTPEKVFAAIRTAEICMQK